MAQDRLDTQRFRRARTVAQERAGQGRISSGDWFPEIAKLVELGYSSGQIANGLNLSERRVSQIRAFGRDDGLVHAVPDAKAPEDMEPRHRAMLPFTADAFEAFFNEFSGHILQPHSREWVDLFVTDVNLMLNVPPRHAKSMIFAIWVPIWLYSRNREEEIILVSKTKELARDWAVEIAYQLEWNQPLISAFGRFAPETKGDIPWRPAQGELMVAGRATSARSGQLSLRSRGSGQHILGREATVAIIDDIADAKVSQSEVQRDEQLRWLREDVFSRVMPENEETASGRVVIIGQRVHYDDIYGELESQVHERGPHKGEPLWTIVKKPAVLRWPDEDPENPEAEVYWPDARPFDWLMTQYERLGGHAAFECMFQQEPRPEGSIVFRDEWLERAHDPRRAGFEGLRTPWKSRARVLSIDPSPTKWNALVVADVPYDRQTFRCAVIEVRRWRGGLRTIVEEIGRCIREYKPDYFIFEQAAAQRWLFEDPIFEGLKPLVRTIPHNTGSNKGDPDMGVESLAGDFEFATISLPYGDEAGRQMSGLLEAEARVWPSVRATSDVLMALWFIKWNYKKLRPKKYVRDGGFSGAEVVPFHQYSDGDTDFVTDKTERRRRRVKSD